VVVPSGESIPNQLATGDQLTQTFTVSNDLGFAWLASAADPTGIAIDHEVTWHGASSSIQMDGWPDEGETYTITSLRANPAADDLRSVGVAREAGSLSELPPSIPAVIGDTAAAWTAGADTDYDKVMAIVNKLKGGEFSYSLDVAYRDDAQSLADFLVTGKRGFCQQFASLMAVMLRSIGVPTRVALGFTAGTPVPGVNSSRAVSMRNYHSWVEVPFQGYGWLSFDPTPGGFVDPAASGYQQLTRDQDIACPTAGRGCSGNKGDGTPSTGPHNGLNPKNPTGDESGGGGDLSSLAAPGVRRSVPLGALAAAAALLGLIAALVIPLLRRGSRRRRLHAARDPRTLILATYDVFGERAGELGWGRSPGETPQEFRRRLSAGGALTDETDPRLVRMTTEVVRAAYGPTPPDAETATDVAADADAVLHELRDAAPLRQRVLGLYRRD
jgi:transglutaminase-like putative cysteine protease